MTAVLRKHVAPRMIVPSCLKYITVSLEYHSGYIGITSR
jgi:hypothetical protein